MKLISRLELISVFKQVRATMTHPLIPVSNPNAVKFAVDFINACEVIAIPTDTVYGIACSATSPKAINKLYAIKGRNENKPVAICVSRVSDVSRWARVDHLPVGLLSSLLPGPVTLVLNCTTQLDRSLTSADGKVGIRIPDCEFIRDVVDKLNGCPIALTSANTSGEPSSISTEEFKALWPFLACTFDQGTLSRYSEHEASTVVDLSFPGFYRVLRKGAAADQTKLVLNTYGLEDKLTNGV